VVNDNLLTPEEADGYGVVPGIVASSSRSKVLLHVQWKTAVQFIGSDDSGLGWGGSRR
jgi:hypothetical protein